MENLSKSKLSERVKMHLAAQTPAESGEAAYDKEGPNDEYHCECCKAIKAVVGKYNGGCAESE